MKIVFITPKFYPSVGGVEKHCYEIGKRLIEKGNELVVITELSPKIYNNNFSNYQSIAQSDTHSINSESGVKSSYFKHFVHKKIKIYAFKFGFNGWFKKFRIWYILFQNRSLVKDADIVHCHDVFVWYLPLRFWFPFKKVFITFHGYESYPISKKAFVIRKISELLTNGNICVGDFIQKWYKTQADFIIYGAVNIPLKTKNILNQSALFFGRLDEQTGIIDYAKGFDLIKKKYPKFKFCIIGDGKFKKKISQKHEVVPAKSNASTYLKNYRYAFVSRYLSILEAIAQKRLVFAMYDNPVKKDYLALSPFAKFIMMMENPDQLAVKVDYFLSHPDEEKKIIDKAYDWVQKQTWEAIVDTYLRLWNK